MIKEAEINLGDVAVCTVVESKFTIKNLSRLATVFKVELEPESLNSYIKFEQSAYRLAAEEKKEVHFTFCSKAEKMLKGDIVCTVRASKRFRIALAARCQLPQVTIVEKEIAFGKVTTLGQSFTQPLTFRNDSQFKGLLELTLSGLPIRGTLQLESVAGYEEYLEYYDPVTQDHSEASS